MKKLQDENIRDVTYDELQNGLDQYAATSDGYDVLQELVRRVCPNMYEGKYEINMPKLSQCDNNLFKFNKKMQQHFAAEAIKNRHYTEKEKATNFLQNIDDSRYETTGQKYVVDLSIITMGSDVIKKKSFTFSGLPVTVEQLAIITTKSTPIIRSVSTQERSQFRKKYKQRSVQTIRTFPVSGLW